MLILAVAALGATKLLIGQTFQQEYMSYVSGIGVAPAGSSHYGEIYAGTINQGDDGKNGDGSAPYLAWIAATYPHATAVVGISIKDDPQAGGYPNVPAAVSAIAYTDRWDDNIRKFAAKFKQYPTMTFLVRLGYEVSVYLFQNTTAYHDCFNKMARIIRDEEGATNAKFIYHPVRGLTDTQQMYPGDKYVDYVGFSVFNNDLSMATDVPNPQVRNLGLDGSRLDENLKKSLDWAVARKPVVFPEASYQKTPDGWIQKVPNTNHTDAFPEYIDRLLEVANMYHPAAISYIDSNWPVHGWTSPWTDSRVEIYQPTYWKPRFVDNPMFVQYNSSA